MASIRSSVEPRLDRLHAAVHASPLLRRFTVCTRILLGIGFIPPSLVKIQGERFTSLPMDTPIGFFFEAMYRSGGYWSFIGWAQLIGALLLLNPGTATLGAVLFFPIILNIFVITVALHFTGTWVITGLMLLACTYLLCWDYDRLKPLVWSPGPSAAARPARVVSPRVRTMERAAYAVMAASGICATLSLRGWVPMRWVPLCIGIGVAGGVCLALSLLLEIREGRAMRAA